MHIISLGAGVQSSTMALMAAVGEIKPMPSYAIFADVQAEPPSVYKWLDWLETQLPFPVLRVTAGSLETESLRVRTSKNGINYTNSNVPVFIKSPYGEKEGLQIRQCTSDFKIDVIHREIRRLARENIKKWRRNKDTPKPVVQGGGISKDESHRMKPARPAYIQNIWPLVDNGMRREHCLSWMQKHGYPKPPRSSCVFCPFHSNAEWRRLRDEEPEEFERAARWEEKYQVALRQVPRIKGAPFLHRSCIPLRDVDLTEDTSQGELWGNECEGMCGV